MSEIIHPAMSDEYETYEEVVIRNVNGFCEIAPCYGYHTVADVQLFVIDQMLALNNVPRSMIPRIRLMVDKYFGIIHPNEE